jgi:hypothetical protein
VRTRRWRGDHERHLRRRVPAHHLEHRDAAAVIVKAGARVSIEVINTDSDTAHGLVVTASGARSSWMPMMTARPAARTCPPTERLQRRSSARKAECIRQDCRRVSVADSTSAGPTGRLG